MSKNALDLLETAQQHIKMEFDPTKNDGTWSLWVDKTKVATSSSFDQILHLVPDYVTSQTGIERFQGNYRFLSNFYPAPLTIGDITYPTSEHAYQAMKTDYESERNLIALAPTPGAAKSMGRKVTLREDWEAVKVDAMRLVLHAKFTQNPRLARNLIATGNQPLTEGNHWGDTFWGKCNGVGLNKLGELLMELRTMLKGQDKS